MAMSGAAWGIRGMTRVAAGAALAFAILTLCALPAAAHASGRAAARAPWSQSDLTAVSSACERIGAPCPAPRTLLRRELGAARRRHQHRAHALRAGARPAIVALGNIAGKVTDSSTHAGLGEIEVCAYEEEAFEEEFFEEEPEGECVFTESTGEYEIEELPAGKYVVEFWDPHQNYVTQLYNGKSIAQAPTPVEVKAGATKENINAVMVEGGHIEGVVTSQETKAPLEGIGVCALGIASFGCARPTGPEGKYLIKGLAEGEYTVVFLVPREPGKNYLTGVEEHVPVQVKKTTSGIDNALLTGGEIKGTVRRALDGTPLAGAEICAYASFEEPAEECTFSGPSGGYVIERLPTSSYFVEFWDEPTYITQYYSASPTLAGASAVPVIAGGAPAEPIDASMHLAAGEPSPPVIVITVPGPGPVIPPAISVLTSKTVVPSLTILGRLKAAGPLATAKLHCGLGPCKGTLQLLASVVKRQRVNGHIVTRRLTALLGSASFSIAQGATSKVKIKLTATGRHLLANAARHPHAATLKLAMQGVHATVRAVVVD
jgi:hypothetical protein